MEGKEELSRKGGREGKEEAEIKGTKEGKRGRMVLNLRCN